VQLFVVLASQEAEGFCDLRYRGRYFGGGEHVGWEELEEAGFVEGLGLASGQHVADALGLHPGCIKLRELLLGHRFLESPLQDSAYSRQVTLRVHPNSRLSL
jgi:hypothetical protein